MYQNLVEEKEKKIKELQDNLAAVNFTASSKLGKMLMAKCRTLQEENEEIGTMASEGKVMQSCFMLPNMLYMMSDTNCCATASTFTILMSIFSPT